MFIHNIDNTCTCLPIKNLKT